MSLYRDEGVVLRTQKLGEADLIEIDVRQPVEEGVRGPAPREGDRRIERDRDDEAVGRERRKVDLTAGFLLVGVGVLVMWALSDQATLEPATV